MDVFLSKQNKGWAQLDNGSAFTHVRAWRQDGPTGGSPNPEDPLLPYRELMGGGVQNQGMTGSCITYPCGQGNRKGPWSGLLC